MPKIKHLLLNNIELKIFSIILSILVWYAIIGQETSEAMMFVPIEYQNLPDYLEIVNNPRKIIELTLKGPSAFLKKLSPQDLKVSLDLSHAQPGDKTFFSSELNIDVPLGISVSKINPSFIKITFDITARKEIPIKPTFSGKLEYGYKLTSVSLEPNHILVEGAQKILNKLTYIHTDPINLEGLKENAIFNVSISGDMPNVRLLESPEITVHLKIEEIYAEKIIKRLAIELNNKKIKYYSPHYVSLSLKAPIRIIENLDLNAIRAIIETEGLRPGKHQVPIKILIPENLKDSLQIVSIEPASAEVYRIKE